MATNSEEIDALKQRVKELEARLAALESVIKVTTGPQLTLTLTAPMITIAAATKMSLDGGAVLTVESGSLMSLKSALITLN